MEFRNLTPYPAMAFDALDQQEQRFHVVVMRLTFELQPDGQLLLAPEQTPLVTSDEYYGEVNRSSVRQESDLAPYKPHTDVIVIADAHAPGGAAASEFDVAITINGAAVEPDLPPEPYGLNPLQPASPERMAQWRQECALDGAGQARPAHSCQDAEHHGATRMAQAFCLPEGPDAVCASCMEADGATTHYHAATALRICLWWREQDS
ncbi:DUF2169 domain-containing protein [Herbaspirillum rubrisubalbicans]|uniref:DUF2169 domain-containing protein n=1 Tax=Herbaspirillum rubrisubalbicans TaxID=80842 RepID=UPI0021AC96A6|nr:DUF2169 domain-containing protein [Herbaspirillum rubrisubalbicans]